MTRLSIALVSFIAFITIGTAAAAPDPGDQSPGPYCDGRELGITEWDAALGMSRNFCACGGADPSTCGPMYAAEVLFFPDGSNATLCGDQLPLLDLCLAQTQACGMGIPFYCWALTGWVF